MKIITTLFITILQMQNIYCQPGLNLLNQNSVMGNITIPQLQSLEVKVNNTPTIYFENSNDLSNGKEIKDFYVITVKSNTPWVLTFNANSSNFTNVSNSALDNMPSNVIFIKRSEENNYKLLPTLPQTLLSNDNDNIANEYRFDVKINPSWQYSGGLYNVGIIFTLTNE